MTEDRGVAPRCGSCGRPHDPALRCWRGRYAHAVTARVLRRQGRVCWICGGEATTADHIVHRSRWGNDTDANLRPACRPCNSRRGTQDNPFDPEPEPRPAGVGLSHRWRTP